jgi:hypothetical protein
MADLIAEIDQVVASPVKDLLECRRWAALGPEQRGLLRLRAMAEICQRSPTLRLRFRGD